MKVIAINGSPRKKWNTATLLEKALEGAASEGAETEIIHLYDLNFKGCTSCFACKLKDGKSYGKCAMNDELTPVLEKLKDADAVILGSPIYLGNSTGEMRSFMERYVFPYLVYSANPQSLYPKNIPIGYIYTMGVKEENFDMFGFSKLIELNEMLQRGSSDIPNHCAVQTHISLMIIQSMLRLILIPKRKQKDEQKCSLWIVRKPLRWVLGS